MYQVGDLIVYGSTGVCTVSEIKTIDAPWASKDQLYYALEPPHGSYIVYAPVNSSRVFTRPAISKDEANRLIDTIPSIEPKVHDCMRPQDMAALYASYIESHDCADLIELTMSLYAKKHQADAAKTKFGSIDQKFMLRAEELLFGELAAALGIPRGEVQDYIASRVGGVKVAV
jgi:CarD family transcriptional regulator, regulator of rRNA transcription